MKSIACGVNTPTNGLRAIGNITIAEFLLKPSPRHLFLSQNSPVSVAQLTKTWAHEKEGGIAFFDPESHAPSADLEGVFDRVVTHENLSPREMEALFDYIRDGGRVFFDVAQRGDVIAALLQHSLANKSKPRILLVVANFQKSFSESDMRAGQIGRSVGMDVVYSSEGPVAFRSEHDEACFMSYFAHA